MVAMAIVVVVELFTKNRDVAIDTAKAHIE